MNKAETTKERFVDKGIQLWDFTDEYLVVCPKCGGRARVLPEKESSRPKVSQIFDDRKLVCPNCAFSDHWKGREIITGANVDPYFRRPLWLEISCCGATLWAYNFEHLEILESYVTAKLRERTNKGRNSFLSKLPNWLKSAKNRREILKAIEKLRDPEYGKN